MYNIESAAPEMVHFNVSGQILYISSIQHMIWMDGSDRTWRFINIRMKKFPGILNFYTPGWILKWNVPGLWLPQRWSTPGVENFVWILNNGVRWGLCVLFVVSVVMCGARFILMRTHAHGKRVIRVLGSWWFQFLTLHTLTIYYLFFFEIFWTSDCATVVWKFSNIPKL